MSCKQIMSKVSSMLVTLQILSVLCVISMVIKFSLDAETLHRSPTVTEWGNFCYILFPIGLALCLNSVRGQIETWRMQHALKRVVRAL